MRNYRKIGHLSRSIIYTLLTAVFLCLVFLFSVNIVYKDAEADGFEYLHMQTKQIKEDLKLQIMSDRENLATIASFAAKIYEEGKDFSLVFDSFESTGLIENIGILKPDNTFRTKVGSISLEGNVSFLEEAEKGAYTSGRVYDWTNPQREIVRNAVPIISNGETVGILYGVIELSELDERYFGIVSELEAQLYVFEKGNGNFLVDTLHAQLGNISVLKDRSYKKGYSYEKFISGENGYSAFLSKEVDDYLYVHYAPLEIGDWYIMLGRYEHNVMENANATARILINAFLLMVLGIMLYIMLLFAGERGKNEITEYASKIRKLLLEINQQHNNIQEALENIALFAKARSAIFVDTDKEDYNYISPGFAKKLLVGNDRQYFISELFKYVTNLCGNETVDVSVITVTANNRMEKEDRKFFEFLKKSDIKKITFAAIRDKKNHVSILGVINPKKGSAVKALLYDIAVCFSISIFNKKHLNKTEFTASTDSLTGLFNRVTYKKDIRKFDEEHPENFACVYVDVNGLHMYNNRYGHAAGDEMLLYIANVLGEVFFSHRVYRMGGDEFLVFMKGVEEKTVEELTNALITSIKPMGYHVAIGVAYRKQNFDTDAMLREAELKMYEAKAQYYQNQEETSVTATGEFDYDYMKTGIDEIDALLNVVKKHYSGACRVSLNSDEIHKIFMPSYFGCDENEKCFSKMFTKYILEVVNPDFSRAMLSFLNYEALKRQLCEGIVPKITYQKVNGETVVLSVYALNSNKENIDDTLWVFERA